MAVDPVCKMEVVESFGKPTLTRDRQTYYFCSEGCRAEFNRRPDEYARGHKTGSTAESDPGRKGEDHSDV